MLLGSERIERRMQNKLIGRCPICQHELYVAKLYCNHCHTSIEGKFTLNKFQRLTEEQLFFVEVFIKNRGNIKEIEKELSISYPTVRNKLESVIEALGYKSKPSVNKRDILDKINKGELTTEEALKLLNE